VNVFWIALATIREAVRGRVVRALAVLSATLVALVALLPAVAAEEKAVMLVKLFVGVAGVVATVSLVFVGSAAVSAEIERGHLAVVLAKPVSRASFVAGRALGVAALAPVLVGALFGIAMLAFRASAAGELPSDCRLLHPEREVAGRVAESAGGSLEWSFDLASLAAPPTALRIRAHAADERIPRVPARVAVSDDSGVVRARDVVLGADLVRDLEIPSDLRNGKGLRVRVTPRDSAAALRADPDAAVLVTSSSSGFAANLARAFASLAAAASLAGVLSVAASAAFGGRVALFLSLALVAGGPLVESMRGFAQIAERGVPPLAGIEAPAVSSPDATRIALGRCIDGLASAMPDFGRFDLSRPLVRGSEIPAATLARNAAYAIAYGAACCALGCLAFRGREVAR
jgi:hypothetical protein